MPSEPCPITSIGQIADTLKVQSWRIARLFELGIVPEPPRLSGRRAIPESMVPTIIAGLRERGWLPDEEEATP